MKAEEVPIGSLVEKCATWNPKKNGGGVFDYIDLSSVDKDSKEIEVVQRHECSDAPSRARQLVEAGDVLVATVRPNLNGVALVREEHEGMTASTGYCVLRPKREELDSSFLFHWVKTSAFVTQMVEVATGANYPAVSDVKVKASRIPLPPLDEQKRIAGVLDAADALRAERREALAQLDTLLQSTFLKMFGECDRPPISIGDPRYGTRARFVPLSEVARLATGHTPDRKKPEYWNGEIPWISLTDIRQIDGTVATETLQNVTDAGISNSASVVLPAGTVCFSRTATIGFVTVMGREMATSQDFVNWVCSDQIDPIYLMWALRQSRPYLLAKSSGSTHKTIYYRYAEQFQVFLPPLDLQRRFATIVESVEQQKTLHRTHLAELDTLFASLQSRAFQGEL